MQVCPGDGSAPAVLTTSHAPDISRNVAFCLLITFVNEMTHSSFDTLFCKERFSGPSCKVFENFFAFVVSSTHSFRCALIMMPLLLSNSPDVYCEITLSMSSLILTMVSSPSGRSCFWVSACLPTIFDFLWGGSFGADEADATDAAPLGMRDVWGDDTGVPGAPERGVGASDSGRPDLGVRGTFLPLACGCFSRGALSESLSEPLPDELESLSSTCLDSTGCCAEAADAVAASARLLLSSAVSAPWVSPMFSSMASAAASSISSACKISPSWAAPTVLTRARALFSTLHVPSSCWRTYTPATFLPWICLFTILEMKRKCSDRTKKRKGGTGGLFWSALGSSWGSCGRERVSELSWEPS
eukprot:6767323-Pyramimonas_sp.AAC.1